MRMAMFGAAFATSTGVFWTLGGRRLPIIGMDLVGKGFGLLAGWWAAQVPLWGNVTLVLPGMLLGAAFVAMLNLIHRGLWCTGVQSFVFFAIGGMLSGHITDPFVLLWHILLAGGGMALWLEMPNFWTRLRGKPLRLKPFPLRQDLASFHRPDALREAATAAIAVGLSYLVAEALAHPRPYWAPLAALMVLRPDHGQTLEIVVRRCLFTLVGCGIATAAVLALPLGHQSVYGLFLLSAMLTAAVNGTEYRYFICALSATVVLMVAMGNGAVAVNAELRVVATLLGGGITAAIVWLMGRVAPLRGPGAQA
jgi:Fusaric acid resistance protein-like